MPIERIKRAVESSQGKEYLKHFAFGVFFIILALVAIEAIGHVAPQLYGDVKLTIKQFGLLGVFIGVLLGSTLLPFPTDLFFTTAVNLSEGLGAKVWIVVIAVIAAFIGSAVNYFLAKVLRDRFASRFASKEQLLEAKEWFDKYGPWPIVIFGVIPVSAVFDPFTFAAGLSGMEVKTFLKYSLLSRLLHFVGIALLASYVVI